MKKLAHVPNSLALLGKNHLWLSPMSADVWGEPLLIMKPLKPENSMSEYPGTIILQLAETKERISFLTVVNCFPNCTASGPPWPWSAASASGPTESHYTSGSVNSGASHSLNVNTPVTKSTYNTDVPCVHIAPCCFPGRTSEPTTHKLNYCLYSCA